MTAADLISEDYISNNKKGKNIKYHSRHLMCPIAFENCLRIKFTEVLQSQRQYDEDQPQTEIIWKQE